VLLVRTDGVQGFHAKNADDRAENIRLFKVKVDQLRRFFLDVVYGFPDMQVA
jgi:hypothetical protein